MRRCESVDRDMAESDDSHGEGLSKPYGVGGGDLSNLKGWPEAVSMLRNGKYMCCSFSHPSAYVCMVAELEPMDDEMDD